MDPDDAPELVPTVIRREPWEIEPRLKELRLTREALLRIVALAMGERANATAFHAANAAGTYAYQAGTFGLRHEFVGRDGWAVDRSNGVEAIFNLVTRARIIFSNVDLCCDDEHEPKPCSGKGAGAERACEGNLFEGLPTYAPRESGAELAFYLMVDGRGVAELSRPVIKGRTFSAYRERNFLYGPNDDDGIERKPLDEDDAVSDFDPQVARK